VETKRHDGRLRLPAVLKTWSVDCSVRHWLQSQTNNNCCFLPEEIQRDCCDMNSGIRFQAKDSQAVW